MITFSANDLRSKYGFNDGDILSDAGLREPTVPQPAGRQHKWKHEVLIRLVRQRLLPLMPLAEVQEIGTHHNPIRLAEWPNCDFIANPITVDIADEMVEAAAQSVEDEWRNAA